MSLNKAPQNNVFYRNQNWSYPKIVKGEGVYLVDENGKKYLDGCSGSAVANIGHGNKEIAEYTKEHIERIAFTHLSRFTVDSIEECAYKVSSYAPKNLNHVYFVSGGSEATETAIKIARQYFVERDGISTSKWKVISKWNSFHGNTLGALSMTGITGRRKIYDPLLVNFPKITQFYHYRNPWGCETLYETSVKAATELEKEILRVGAHNVAAFITEPVIGSAAPGVHPESVYFSLVRDICNKYDVLLIVDEVMSGFGRTGKKLAIDHFNALPDIITCAKGMSSGYTPIGATIVSDEIFNAIMVRGSGKFVHGHTYAGNPLSCGIANKVIEIIERENYINNADLVGKYLNKKLTSLNKYEIVGDIRGKGLMFGIEFVADKDSKNPFDPSLNIKNIIMENCLNNGLVVYPGGGSVDGVSGDHILIAPPINISKDEIDELINSLTKGIELTIKQL